MELSVIFLCGILFGAFNFGFFCLGYYVRSKKPSDDSVEVTKDNAKALEDITKWMNYNGR